MRRIGMALLLSLGSALGGTPAQADEQPLTYAPVSARSALLEAAKRGDEEQVRRLLAEGAEPAFRDGMGRTPLHYAARLGYDRVVELLVAHGARVDVADEDGYTPLIRAAQAAHVGVVAYLLDHGADPSIRVDGRTAADLARERGHAEVVRLLEG